jgi:hypothetical protein
LQDFCQKREMTALELPDSSSGPSLMVAKGVLDLHGATLLIDNEAEGARMLVRMPAQLEETFRPRAAGILPA